MDMMQVTCVCSWVPISLVQSEVSVFYKVLADGDKDNFNDRPYTENGMYQSNSYTIIG